MQEDFLHYLWKHKKFNASHLKTNDGETIDIISVGIYNQNTGPDFFNAKLRIGGQLWAGNVEVHVKSSDWYLHHHETDSNYDNVILHVVWESDTEVFRKDNTIIPTLVLKQYVSEKALNNYGKLFSGLQRWINCEHDFSKVDVFTVNHWLERLYFERLERKAEHIKQLLIDSKNDWEAVLFKMLAKNFGLKVNGESFLSLACSIDFLVVRKLQQNQVALEALFFGQAGLLDDDVQDPYFLSLAKEYKFLRQKFNLTNKNVSAVQFFRLRPPNFPTIRLSQLANLYSQNKTLFSNIIETNDLNKMYELFAISTSLYWESHYIFGKTSKRSKKKLTKAFIDLLVINTIIPIKFCYVQHTGRQANDDILSLVRLVAPEKNSIVEKFDSLKPVSSSALQSQALIQLKNDYCDKNKCLQCAIGSAILTGNH